ncbi:hypothetical protein PIB30_016766 [Stylosanthes scabra]|uniref:Uncharacterized protein n=1 Tax=Stylosanthes scabra TaxID=79078 RepID=A0ABU6Q8D0_9FABA|nr:hypothetical protein [Stylosanthes scabra]
MAHFSSAVKFDIEKFDGRIVFLSLACGKFKVYKQPKNFEKSLKSYIRRKDNASSYGPGSKPNKKNETGSPRPHSLFSPESYGTLTSSSHLKPYLSPYPSHRHGLPPPHSPNFQLPFPSHPLVVSLLPARLNLKSVIVVFKSVGHRSACTPSVLSLALCSQRSCRERSKPLTSRFREGYQESPRFDLIERSVTNHPMFKVSEMKTRIDGSVVLHVGWFYEVSWGLDFEDPTRERGVTVDGRCFFSVYCFLILAKDLLLSTPVFFRGGVPIIRVALMTPLPG